MNHKQHKFLTTAIVFVIMVVGVSIAARFNDISLGAMNIGLLLVNALLLLIILSILLHIKENLTENKQKSGIFGVPKIRRIFAENKKKG
ncbi:MAG: hypothetical protein Q8R04_00095 [Nanoarchaeota archaeon]|nr:hypothetical protein [Nanoarchaeota archaeon]